MSDRSPGGRRPFSLPPLSSSHRHRWRPANYAACLARLPQDLTNGRCTDLDRSSIGVSDARRRVATQTNRVFFFDCRSRIPPNVMKNCRTFLADAGAPTRRIDCRSRSGRLMTTGKKEDQVWSERRLVPLLATRRRAGDSKSQWTAQWLSCSRPIAAASARANPLKGHSSLAERC